MNTKIIGLKFIKLKNSQNPRRTFINFLTLQLVEVACKVEVPDLHLLEAYKMNPLSFSSFKSTNTHSQAQKMLT